MFIEQTFSSEQVAKRPEWRKELIRFMGINDAQRAKIFKFKRKFQLEKKNLDK